MNLLRQYKRPDSDNIKAGQFLPVDKISLDREGTFDFVIRAGLLARGSSYRPPLPA